MPHAYNRSAFDVGRSSSNGLLSVYCSLVIIELGLKDARTTWPNGHYLAAWLNDLADAGLTSLTQQLITCLGTLKCTDRNGGVTRADLNSYPDVRYLRHEADFPGQSNDADLLACVAVIQDIETVLKGRGIL